LHKADKAREPVCEDGPLKWRRVSGYCITAGVLNICAIYVAGVTRYELWDLTARPHRLLGAYGSAEEAREAANDLR